VLNCSKHLFKVDRISLQEHRLLLRFDKDMDICKLKFVQYDCTLCCVYVKTIM